LPSSVTAGIWNVWVVLPGTKAEYIGEKSICTVGVGHIPGDVVTVLVASVVGPPASSRPAPLCDDVAPELVALELPELTPLPLPDEPTFPFDEEPVEFDPEPVEPPQAARPTPNASTATSAPVPWALPRG
jgi:hypothetical protein